MMKTNAPTHDDITRRAREIWHNRGCPAGCDTAIWCEAEKQLTVAEAPSAPVEAGEFPGASPDARAAQIDRQKNSARAPRFQRGVKAPKPEPADTGKPLWQRPHSS